MVESASHEELMDQTYRYQRLIYDATRKYYLLGRDHLIKNMDVQPGARVLEVACGTGRNLSVIQAHYPQAELFGFDISEQMLVTARSKLNEAVHLAKADACQFNPEELFGVQDFDHIVLSFCLSMIPEWETALIEAGRHLAPNGRLHVVDFGDCSGLPNWFRAGLHAWLARFHVMPRASLQDALEDLSKTNGISTYRQLYRNYSAFGTFTNGASGVTS